MEALRADVEGLVRAALHEFNVQKEREWAEREQAIRRELGAAFEKELEAARTEGKKWESECKELRADAERMRFAAAEEARLQTLKNLATTMHEIELRYEEKLAQLEEQLRRAEDALLAQIIQAPAGATLPVEPALPEVSTTHVQRIAAVEARFKARKEEILRSLQAAAEPKTT